MKKLEYEWALSGREYTDLTRRQRSPALQRLREALSTLGRACTSVVTVTREGRLETCVGAALTPADFGRAETVLLERAKSSLAELPARRDRRNLARSALSPE